MSNPDWTEAPEGATHWDTRGAVWCKHLHFWCYGRWNHEGAIHDLAEDRYTPRPVEQSPTAWPHDPRLLALNPRTGALVRVESFRGVASAGTYDAKVHSEWRTADLFADNAYGVVGAG